MPMTTTPPGRYLNPVLDADWPDPDAIRDGDTYVMVVSSFNRAPGLPVLTSPDLVNWTVASHALPAVPPVDHFALPRHGDGVWAPAIRRHGDDLVIVYPDPDHGIFSTRARSAAGPWSEPTLLLAGSGLIDPCPLWDDDGRAYLVHGWAASRAGVKNRLTVVEVAPDLSRPIGRPRTVVDGDALPGYTTLEGPKFYKRDGWYWIFAPAGGVSTGWQSVFRSRDVFGPYSGRIVLAQGDTPINGAHQGAWVDTPDGDDWFLHFQDRGAYGRVVHLQPMAWDDDGWPVLGESGPDGVGRPVLEHHSPVPGTVQAGHGPDGSDDFTAAGLGPQWHWQANPAPHWAHPNGSGSLALAAVPADRGDLRGLGNVLGQVLPGQPLTATTTLSLPDGVPGTRAGLVILGQAYCWLGLERTENGVTVAAGRLLDGVTEERVHRSDLPGPATIEIRLTSDGTGTADLAYRLPDSADWVRAVGGFEVRPGRWIGAELGLFAVAPVGTDEGTRARFGPVTLSLHGSTYAAQVRANAATAGVIA